MAIIYCKACGGDLSIIEGTSTAKCDFCGRIQTIPKVDDEKKLTLFARANRLRSACEFDKAAGIYESIVADFPEEAEAYWGLVLCKYGIEYVDDPGTGNKVPTCHRSSYDSVMDDSNFEQAMENADIAAQKLYREEAKQIERIRKGILEVSSKEQPYDIFICYKETDPKGDRTLDSVLAQDLYSALTDKGYRVFFSRITLQGKLGEAYEPYIFAALNSAKVMLAVGTSYEYYNAVWVKNEWSRYLKICEADKSKHLIPCYKNLDPEDMPKEFNHLQGADLGKMGAVQDILFNMEKYIPLKKQTTTVIQEKVVVGGTAGNKIASLLDRGNMALEDGDWAKADSFFEDVLNNDSKNAQAYLGKTLATEKCRTIDAFARKRKEVSQSAQTKRYQISPQTGYVTEIVKQYLVPGYVDGAEIRKLYDFDLSYPSEADSRREQYKAEEAYWLNHKWLSKAEKFAVGEMAEHLQREKKSLFETLAERIKSAEAAEKAARKQVEERYAQHIAHADPKAEELYQAGLKRRETDYQDLLQIAKTSSNVVKLKETASKFAALGDYQDSKNLAEHCRKRAAEEQAKIDAEAERQRILKEKEAAARKKKAILIASVASVVIVVALAAAFVVTQVVIPGNKYNQAVQLMENGQYEAAISAFDALGGFKDSRKQIHEIYRLQAIADIESGNYEEALDLLEDAERHVDVTAEKDECYYQMAVAQISQGKGGGDQLLAQVQEPNVFSDYEDLKAYCEHLKTMWTVMDNGLESQIEIREFEDTLLAMETIIAKWNLEVMLSEEYAELAKNLDHYREYITENGNYTTLYSDGSGGGYASLAVTRYGLEIYGIGPGAYLKEGELSVEKDGNAYFNADSYSYTLLDDGRVEMREIDTRGTKIHYIIPED